jgi:hypothetical protein
MDDDMPIAARVIVGIGVVAAVVLSTWMTVIAFIGGTMPIIGWETDGGIVTGLVWLIIVDPLVMTVCFWATMLLAIPVALVIRPKD